MFFFVLSTPEQEKHFLEIYEKYNKYIYSISWGIFKNAQSAEDNTQEVLMYIIDNYSKFENLNDERIKGLIYLTTSGLAKNRLRNDSRHNVTAVSYDAETMPEPVDESAFDAFDTAIIASAIDTLSDKYKIPLYYSCIYGYNSKEIAKILNISDALVRKRIQMAKQELLKILGGKS